MQPEVHTEAEFAHTTAATEEDSARKRKLCRSRFHRGSRRQRRPTTGIAGGLACGRVDNFCWTCCRARARTRAIMPADVRCSARLLGLQAQRQRRTAADLKTVTPKAVDSARAHVLATSWSAGARAGADHGPCGTRARTASLGPVPCPARRPGPKIRQSPGEFLNSLPSSLSCLPVVT